MYSTELEIKETTEIITSASYLNFLLSIGSHSQLTLPCTTNEMISISTSHTFRSWVIIFHLRRPMTFLSLSLYDTTGLAPRMNVFFSEDKRLSIKLLQKGYFVEHLKSSFRKFYCRYGDLIQEYEISFSRMLNAILNPWPVTVIFQLMKLFPPISWSWYR